MVLRQEESYQQPDVNLDFVLNSAYNGIIAIDTEGRITVFNEAARAILQYEGPALGRPIEEVIPNTRLPYVVKSGRSDTGAKIFLNNAIYLANRTPIKEKGRVIGAVAVFQDISRLERFADELARVKEFKSTLEIILENAFEGIVVVNAEGLVTMCNKAYADFMQVRSEDIINHPVTEVLPQTQLLQVIQTGLAEIGHVHRINQNEALASYYPVRRDGLIVGAIGKIIVKDLDELHALNQKVHTLRSKLAYYQDELQRFRGAKFNINSIVGLSEQIQQIKETIRKVARSNSTVLIRGESGTGKELFAHALHSESPRRFGPFVKVNCAAGSGTNIEAELFGYMEGAFPTARKGGHVGKFEIADGGTIFLDEIGELPLIAQAKLIRVLQEKEIERMGEGKPRKIDVRIIGATNRNLEELIRTGHFREDLYYRLNVLSLAIPPLRDRREDIKPLLQFFIQQFNRDFGQQVKGVAPEAFNLLYKYHWSGNVRELENVIERAFNVLDGEVIQPKHLPMYLQKFAPVNFNIQESRSLQRILDETERAVISQALLSTNGNKVQAAKLLGISRASIYQKLAKYNIHDE